MSKLKLDRLALIFCALFCGLAAPSSLRAAPAWKVQDNSLPLQSGPGIVVCEPVTAPADPGAAGFGAGCALWLQLTVGGQPQLGKTPRWESLSRARTELGRPDLQLSAAEAPNLAPILGVTHAVIGTLRGAGPHTALTYTLLRVPSGAAVGAPLRLVGTLGQIAAALPSAARTLAKRLGVTANDVPASTGLSPTDLQTLGRMRWQAAARTGAQQAALEAMAAHSLLAGLLDLSGGAPHTGAQFSALAQGMLTKAGDNTLVWGEIAGLDGPAVLPHAAELTALTTRYPGNYNLASAETFRCRAAQDRKPELQAAERVIKDAPHNPDGWLTYATSLSGTADDLRHGRYYGLLSPAESTQLQLLYPRWEAADHRAVQLDPAFTKGWQRLMVSATFNSDTTLADTALQTALALGADKSDVYGWALEMYQPKWGGDAAKLARFAQLAAADTTLEAAEAVYIARELKSGGNPDLQQKVLTGFIARRRAYLAAHPSDGGGHWGLAAVLEAAGDRDGALAEYRTAASLLPDGAQGASVRYDLGHALSRAGTNDQALAPLREAVRLDPDLAVAYYLLGYNQYHLGHYEDAKVELRTALRLSPFLERAYATLGDVFLMQNNPAEEVPNYQAAIRYGAYSRDNYDHLVAALAATGQSAQVLTTGEEALRNYPDGDAVLFDDMADACLHTKEWDRSIAFSQAALALDASDALAHENLGEAYLGAGRVADAQAEWKKVLTLKNEPLKAVAEGFLKKYP